VWRHVRSLPNYDRAVVSAETSRLRQRHSDHVIALMRDGISMRTIRRHRLDDPRLTDVLRTVLVEAARERQRKARFRRSEEQRKEDSLRRLMTLGPAVDRSATTGLEAGYPEGNSHVATLVLEPLAVPAAIQAIRKHVCEHFYMPEMRDPELRVRTNRRAYVLPRQIAMYIARHHTGATLKEISREFGNRHHTTVLHSIRRIEEVLRSDGALDGAIRRLMDDTSPLVRAASFVGLATTAPR
jgi:hypothetical protein